MPAGSEGPSCVKLAWRHGPHVPLRRFLKKWLRVVEATRRNFSTESEHCCRRSLARHVEGLVFSWRCLANEFERLQKDMQGRLLDDIREEFRRWTVKFSEWWRESHDVEVEPARTGERMRSVAADLEGFRGVVKGWHSVARERWVEGNVMRKEESTREGGEA